MSIIDISRQAKAINDQLLYMKQLAYKLNNQLRHYKELRLFKSIIKQTQKSLHIQIEQDIKKIDSIPVQQTLRTYSKILVLCLELGNRLKQFIAKAYLAQFAVIAMSNIAVVHHNITKIKKKFDVIARIQSERRKSGKQIN